MLELIILGIIVESVWEFSKMIWQDGKFQMDKLGSLIVALILAFAVEIDFLDIVGISSKISYVGIVLSGFAIARGGNGVHELFERIGDR